MCFILRLAPCFVATARAVLLSALACIRNDSPISFSMACAKINSADGAPRAYISDSPLDKATVPLSSTFTRQEKLINVTQCARCAFPRHWITSPVSVRMSRDLFQGLVQVIWFQCRYRQVEIQLSCSFQISQHSLGTCQSASVGEASLYDKHFVANIKSGLTPVMYCSFPTTALNNEC